MAEREDPESLNKLPSSTSTRPRQLAFPTNKKKAAEHPATTSQPWVVSLDTLGGIRETIYLWYLAYLVYLGPEQRYVPVSTLVVTFILNQIRLYGTHWGPNVAVSFQIHSQKV